MEIFRVSPFTLCPIQESGYSCPYPVKPNHTFCPYHTCDRCRGQCKLNSSYCDNCTKSIVTHVSDTDCVIDEGHEIDWCEAPDSNEGVCSLIAEPGEKFCEQHLCPQCRSQKAPDQVRCSDCLTCRVGRNSDQKCNGQTRIGHYYCSNHGCACGRSKESHVSKCIYCI